MGATRQRRHFKVTVRFLGVARRVLVTVYGSLAEMRAVPGDSDHSWALAITHRWEQCRYGPDGDVTVHPECAHIRLVQGHLGVGTLTHEAGHAALHIWELGYGGLQLSTDDLAREEDFCYLLGDLMSRLVRRLDLYGFYDRA